MRLKGMQISLSALAVSAIGVAALTGCGGGGGDDASTLPVTITESNGAASYDVPASAGGGLVKLKVTNKGKAPHAVQLIGIEGDHTGQDALGVITGSSDTTPDWIRADGGTGAVPPGKTVSAFVNLGEGKYVVADLGGPGGAPTVSKEFEVSGGSDADLPETSAAVSAVAKGKDSYAWDDSGLKTGTNTLTFKSEGKDTIHFVGGFRITGKHTDAEIKQALQSNSLPSWVDQQSFVETAALDGGKSQVTDLDLDKAGTWVLFCPLTDRDGGKPHFLEGLLSQVSIK